MKAARVVFDSLSELRLLAQNPLRIPDRQILALKQFFAKRACTVLMLDDRTSETGDVQLHSIAHGVISLDQVPREFGAERRRLRVVKMRGIKFPWWLPRLRAGDRRNRGLIPQLVAAEHHATFDPQGKSTGSGELDLLLGGGLVPGTNTLQMGPSGVGKTTTGISCMLAALERGETASYYLFDEGIATVLARSAMLGWTSGHTLAVGA